MSDGDIPSTIRPYQLVMAIWFGGSAAGIIYALIWIVGIEGSLLPFGVLCFSAIGPILFFYLFITRCETMS